MKLGKYLTRDGRSVRVICVDAKAPQPVIGLVMCSDGREHLHTYTAEGRWEPDHESGLDLCPESLE